MEQVQSTTRCVKSIMKMQFVLNGVERYWCTVYTYIVVGIVSIMLCLILIILITDDLQSFFIISQIYHFHVINDNYYDYMVRRYTQHNTSLYLVVSLFVGQLLTD